MKAYKVNLIGTPTHYLVTAKQKTALDQMLNDERKRGAVATIGEDTVRLSMIRSITLTNVDLESCPDYFQQAVEREQKGTTKPSTPTYRKLPSEWIIIDKQGRILETSASSKAIEATAEKILALGDPEEDSTRRLIVARAHYLAGTDQIKQYYTALEQLPEAFLCFPNAENPASLIVRQIYIYGEERMKK